MSTTEIPVSQRVSNLEVLGEAECMELLAREPVGRLAFSANALPVVLPVNFVVADRAIVFASDGGLKVRAAQEESVACLEVDGYDRWAHGGWSVLATGRLREINDRGRLEHARALPLSPWAINAPHHYLELSIELLSGRRISRP